VSPPLPGKEPAKVSATTYTPTTHSQPQGIRKKRKQQQTRAQKRRQEKLLERAAVVVEQREVKVGRSNGKLKSVRDRRREWEDVNGERKRKKRLAGSKGEDEEMADDEVQGIKMDVDVEGKDQPQQQTDKATTGEGDAPRIDGNEEEDIL
jgi:Alb1